MPRLWNETIEAHRHAVGEAILDSVWALVAEHGLTSVTMSQIAEKTGIGRATLYKYFPDVDAVLAAWHERHVQGHLRRLAEIRDQGGKAGQRLEAVLTAFGLICHHRQHHSADLAAVLHRGEHVAHAEQQLHGLIAQLLTEAANAGDVRRDITPEELASYCLHALSAARDLPSETKVPGLVDVVLAGMRPHHDPTDRQRRPHMTQM